MTFPKTLIIGGVKWKIIFDKTQGGFFDWQDHIIKIEKKYSDERRFQCLIHEICEIIFLNNNYRYKKCLNEVHNGDFLFSVNHNEFEIFTDELQGILKQFMRRIR